MKKIKFEHNVYSKCRPFSHIFEDNDCVVRAFSVASGLPYKSVHAIAEKHGRLKNCGVTDDVILKIASELGFVNVYQPSKFSSTLASRLWPTFSNTVKNRLSSEHDYVLCTGSHAFAYCHGVAHDWKGSMIRPRTRIQLIFCKL